MLQAPLHCIAILLDTGTHLVALPAGRCATTELPLLPGAEKDEVEEEVATTLRCSSGSLNASMAVTLLPGAELWPDLQQSCIT
jgi:hypothetical protein